MRIFSALILLFLTVNSFSQTLKDDIFENIDYFYDIDGNILCKLIGLRGKKGAVYIAKFADVNNMDEASQYKHSKLYIPKILLPEIESECEYYYSDLAGCDVRSNDSDAIIAQVKHVHNFGAGDLLELKFLNQKETIFYPFNKDFIVDVNLDNKIIIIQKDALE